MYAAGSSCGGSAGVTEHLHSITWRWCTCEGYRQLLSNPILFFVFSLSIASRFAWRKRVADVPAAARRPKWKREARIWNATRCSFYQNCRLHLKGCDPGTKELCRKVKTVDLCCATKESWYIPVPCSGTANADTACPNRARRTAFSCSNSSFLRMRSIILDEEPVSSWAVRSRTWRSRVSMWSLVLWRIARCASRSFARFRSSWAAVSVVTLRVPARDGRFLEPGVVLASEPEE
jgi:hypothetical protein